jgi:hypothetical protein
MSLSSFHLSVVSQYKHTFHYINFIHVQMHTQGTFTAVQNVDGSFIVNGWRRRPPDMEGTWEYND